MFRMTITALALALALSLVEAGAAPSAAPISVVGDPLVAKYDSLSAEGGLIEFVPPNETIEDWTRLVGYRAFLDSRQTAPEAAAALARQTRQRFPGTQVRLFKRGNEAVVGFALATSDEAAEYNVFRYALGPGGHGLVSLQYARRLRGRNLELMPKQAPRWAAEIAGFDMNRVRAAFAQPRE